MTFFRKLFSQTGNPGHRAPEILSAMAGGYATSDGLDFYYAALREDRPYVIAMREVACDTLHRC